MIDEQWPPPAGRPGPREWQAHHLAPEPWSGHRLRKGFFADFDRIREAGGPAQSLGNHSSVPCRVVVLREGVAFCDRVIPVLDSAIPAGRSPDPCGLLLVTGKPAPSGGRARLT